MSSTITLVGNLTREPILRRTNSGTSVAELGLAVNRRWRHEDEWQESTSFFNVIAWRGLAENVVSSLHRGDLVVVCGRLEQRSWTTEGGDRRTTIEVVADEIAPSLRWATVDLARNRRPDATSDVLALAGAPAADGERLVA